MLWSLHLIMRRDYPSYSVSEVRYFHLFSLTNCPIAFPDICSWNRCSADSALSIGTDPTVVEDAVKYIIFLVDADRLFDTALGMYDFNLVLMIAQRAQKVCSHLYVSYRKHADFSLLFCFCRAFASRLMWCGIGVYIGSEGVPSFPSRITRVGSTLSEI